MTNQEGAGSGGCGYTEITHDINDGGGGVARWQRPAAAAVGIEARGGRGGEEEGAYRAALVAAMMMVRCKQ